MPSRSIHHIEVDAEGVGERLDRLIAAQAWAPSRSQIKSAVSRGDVLVNGEPSKAGYAVRLGDRVEVILSVASNPRLLPEPMDLDIEYEDERLLVVNKPSGLVVHPAPGHWSGTLVNGLLAHCGDQLSVFDMDVRPGIVHRLDKDTSGLLVVAKDTTAHQHLAEQFAAHTTERCYVALCHAPGLADRVVFDTLHGRHPGDRKRFSTRVHEGRRAITRVEVLERFTDGAALVECRLQTGRTHQIRVHLSENHAPLLGDPIYGSRLTKSCRVISRLGLHAQSLGFEHPDGERGRLHFEAPLPPDFSAALDALREGRAWR